MRKSDKLQLEMSELREAVNGALEKDDMTDAERMEMQKKTKRMQEIEPEMRAAITLEAAEDSELRNGFTEDAETREFRALETRSNLSGYVSMAMTGGRIAGAELELNQALKIPEDHFPMRLLAPGAEHRASTAAEALAAQPRWVDRLFADTAAMALGMTFDSAAPGVQAYPVTTGGASSAQRGKAQAAADAAWTVGVTELKPTRNSVRAVFVIEDAARLPTLEEALTRDLRAALVEGVDRAIFIGDSTANPNAGDITGLTTASIDETTITQANKATGTGSMAPFANLIDGIHAATPADLKIVMAVGANAYWMAKNANTGAAVDTTVAEYLRRAGFNWTVRGNIEDSTVDGDFGAFVGLARGITGAGVAAIWDAAQLIRDPYSNAAKGEVALTMHHLWAFGLPRTSNFKRIKFVT